MADTSPSFHPYVGIDSAAGTFTAAWLAPGGTLTAPLTRDQTLAGYAGAGR